MARGEGSSSIYRCIPSCPTVEEGCIVSDSYCSNCYRFVPRKYCEDCYTCLFYELRGVKEENEILRTEGEKQLGIIENLREEMRLLQEEGANQLGQIIHSLRQQISSLRSESAKQSGIIQKMQQEIEVLRADKAKQDKSAEEEEIEFLRKISGEALATPDVTLCASDGSRFKAHSLILVNRSDVFRAMFEGDLMQQKKGVIVIKEVGDKIIMFQVVANEMGKQNIVMKEVGGESIVFQVAGFMANRRAEVIVEVGGDSLKVFLNFLYTRKVDDNEIFANYKQLARLAAIFQIKLLFTRLNLCLEAFLQGRHTIGYKPLSV